MGEVRINFNFRKRRNNRKSSELILIVINEGAGHSTECERGSPVKIRRGPATVNEERLFDATVCLSNGKEREAMTHKPGDLLSSGVFLILRGVRIQETMIKTLICKVTFFRVNQNRNTYEIRLLLNRAAFFDA
jgi:hypothetical protein